MASSNQPSLAQFLAENYGAIKARFPGEGRRKWRLRAAEQFWSLSAEQKASYLTLISQNPLPTKTVEDADFTTDEDPLDELSDDAPGIGLLVRTDYTDDAAWHAFHTKLQEAETEFASEPELETNPDPDPLGEGPSAARAATASSSVDAQGDTTMAHEETVVEEDTDEDAADENSTAPILFVINAAGAAERARLSGLSNLAALRLLNDVDVRRAPKPPQGARRIKPPNRLIDHDGWQETYTGKTVWIYDARSNQDQCARLVSQCGAAMYGTATADSWRARVGHICELQVNLAAGAMTIDFGGLDRWDYEERARNLTEAVRAAA
ncbi:hypothetical protein C2E23DRAFT_855529 [Lenzites betulinus]|nr:hypothetical protein C2E23DRAFT_855529 [Lenzites betulinus]